MVYIADATAQALINNKIKKVGLLGTSFTMEQEFYKGRLIKNFNMNVITPNKIDRKNIHHIIYDELCVGKIEEMSKRALIHIIETLSEMGAEAVILGCTEIGLLIDQSDTQIPLYDTTEIHASNAVEYALY